MYPSSVGPPQAVGISSSTIKSRINNVQEEILGSSSSPIIITLLHACFVLRVFTLRAKSSPCEQSHRRGLSLQGTRRDVNSSLKTNRREDREWLVCWVFVGDTDTQMDLQSL